MRNNQVINTMMDPSIPLTINEYEEWGNPNEIDYFKYILEYSPYLHLIQLREPQSCQNPTLASESWPQRPAGPVLGAGKVSISKEGTLRNCARSKRGCQKLNAVLWFLTVRWDRAISGAVVDVCVVDVDAYWKETSSDYAFAINLLLEAQVANLGDAVKGL
jgi:hypothetical protein